jgi:hypothetical protein
MYQITDYTYRQAKKLGVEVKPSTDKKKKIDVIKNVKKIASVGANGYNDYPTYVKEKGLSYANERRKLYKIRHSKDRVKIGSNGYFADKLLW